jgi:hypothetical protein
MQTDALRVVKISDKYLRPTNVEIIALRSRPFLLRTPTKPATSRFVFES